MTNVVTRPDEEALAIQKEIRRRAGPLFRVLDTDGDGVLLPEEIAAAPDKCFASINARLTIQESKP